MQGQQQQRPFKRLSSKLINEGSGEYWVMVRSIKCKHAFSFFLEESVEES